MLRSIKQLHGSPEGCKHGHLESSHISAVPAPRHRHHACTVMTHNPCLGNSRSKEVLKAVDCGGIRTSLETMLHTRPYETEKGCRKCLPRLLLIVHHFTCSQWGCFDSPIQNKSLLGS